MHFNDASNWKTVIVYTGLNKMQINKWISPTSDYLLFDSYLLKTVCFGVRVLEYGQSRQLSQALSTSPEPSFPFADFTTVACSTLTVMTDAPEAFQKLILIGF